MPAGRRTRLPALVGGLVLLAVMGVLVSRRARRDPERVAVCPRTFGQTQLAAMLLWDNAGGSLAPAPEVRRLAQQELTPLADPEDTETCRRLLASLPDTLEPGVLSGHVVGLFQVGELYIVVALPNLTASERDAVARGDLLPERAGETRIFARDFRLLATYSN